MVVVVVVVVHATCSVRPRTGSAVPSSGWHLDLLAGAYYSAHGRRTPIDTPVTRTSNSRLKSKSCLEDSVHAVCIFACSFLHSWWLSTLNRKASAVQVDGDDDDH